MIVRDKINDISRGLTTNSLPSHTLVGLGIIVIVLLTGCIQRLEDTRHTPVPIIPIQNINKPTAPLDVNLSLNGIPKLNQIVELTFTVTSQIDFPNMSIEIQLPDGFSFVGGNLSWKGYIAKKETKITQTTIKAVKTGNWTIIALARNIRQIDNFTEIEGKADVLFISVSNDTAIVSKEEPIFSRLPMDERIGQNKREMT